MAESSKLVTKVSQRCQGPMTLGWLCFGWTLACDSAKHALPPGLWPAVVDALELGLQPFLWLTALRGKSTGSQIFRT